MAAGLNGYSFVPDRTTYGTREEFVSRHVPDRLGAPAAYDYSSSLERDARGQTPTQYPGGILLGPSMGPQGGMDSNSPDADRWLRSCMDFGPRGSTMLSSPRAHLGGFLGVSTPARGFGTQDVRLEDRQSHEARTLSVTLPQRPIGDDSITLGPQGGLGIGMSIRGAPAI
ncbi:Eukaryotic translation initiation factor 4G [Morella rubra]|uniref:Eukaryotic translation initiation factor 4G n=1 Tax=Morella rubra TaxID=262757 RepID=A0A6A1WIT8_9ROSI|nr:Eukaryotic translation initiation factor 4G [Morella rubra]